MSLITRRQKADKRLLLEQLEKTPIVQIACEKTGIARATYYRWLQSDQVFSRSAKEAIRIGVLMMNDLAESQLLKSIKEGNMTGIIFWLRSRHSAYGQKIEISDVRENDDLTSEQKSVVRRMLTMYKKKSQ